MGQIGIMTYHAAHNFGSVLQAYATQNLLKELGYANEIINYRLSNQKEYYNKLYTTKFGYKEFLRQLIRIKEAGDRKIRIEKFEDFIRNKLELTEIEYNSYSELCNARIQYQVLLSGSDQIWNEHCRAEFWTEPSDSILGYYLAFGDSTSKKISFSSSFGGMKKDEIKKYLPQLEKFQAISIREAEGAKLLSSMLSRNVYNTLDPTLMLDSHQWLIDGTYDVESNYIFVYTLSRFKTANDFLKNVKKLANKFGKKIVCVAPFSNIVDKDIETRADFGPLDFLSYIRCAFLVITDSFHGMAFSVNFEIPFYSVGIGHDTRKAQLLKKLGLEGCICKDLSDLTKVDDYSCELKKATTLLNEERDKSKQYLVKALKEVLPLD